MPFILPLEIVIEPSLKPDDLQIYATRLCDLSEDRIRELVISSIEVMMKLQH